VSLIHIYSYWFSWCV